MKKILIVGATSAIAQEVSKIYAREKSELILWGRNAQMLDVISQGTMRDTAEAGMDMTEVFALDIPARFAQLALVDTEFRRSVVHLFPAAEQAALSGGRRD